MAGVSLLTAGLEERDLTRLDEYRAAGGYELVDAITQMALTVTDDGRIVQYPPDQRPPAVWHLTTH